MDEEFGRYRLRGLLGAGGMGQVHRAYDTELHREVAIKLLPPQASSDPSFEQRFRREARTAAGLDEPHVVPIFDSGQINGRLFIAMRLIDGTDVATLLRDTGPMPPEQAVAVIEQAAAALDAAHGAGLVHRDVKPANLLVTPKNFVYLIDFGIARAAGETKLTGTGAAIGTVAYMAPERFTTGHADHRADIYALTCVLHECLTGTTPYPVTSLEQQMFAHVNGPPPRPSQTRPDIPAGFDDVIARGMARDPDQRYQSAGELAEAARGALATAPPISTPVTTPPPTPAAVTDPTPAPTPAAAANPAASTPLKLFRRDLTLRAPTQLAATTPTTNPRPATLQRHYQTPAGPTALAATRPAVVPPPVSATKPKRRSRLRWGALPIAGVVLMLATLATVIPYRALNERIERPGSEAKRTTTSAVPFAVTATIKVGRQPQAVAVDPTTHTAYVTHLMSGANVSVIDTNTNTVTATIEAGNSTYRAAVDPDTHTAYITGYDGGVSVIDTNTNNITTTIHSLYERSSVAVDPTTHTALIVGESGDVTVIDTNTNTITATITNSVGRNHGRSAVAVNLTTHTAYATYEAGDGGNVTGRVSVIDTSTSRVTTTINVNDRPKGIAVDPTINTAYVSGFEMTIIDTTTNAVTTAIRVGKYPGAVAIDAATHTAYVGGDSDDDSVVTVIDTATNTVTGTIAVGRAPRQLAVDPTTHAVYVVNELDATVSVIQPTR